MEKKTNDKVKRLSDISKVLNEWGIISVNQLSIHCRERFFSEHFEPQYLENTGKYMTAKAKVDGIEFYALFNLPAPVDLEECYQKAVRKFTEVKP